MNNMRPASFSILPTMVKNLLIINGLFFISKILFSFKNIDLDALLGLHYFAASDFKPWQVITYMFMHNDFGHLFFNMFALWMFGAMVENVWGARRFLIYYLITGIGAAFIHYLIIFFQISPELALMTQFLDAPSLDTYAYMMQHCNDAILQEAFNHNWLLLQQSPDQIDAIVNATQSIQTSYLNEFNIIGASGSVFGILLAFGMMFPNVPIYIYFLFPIKAKWLVIIYGALELFYGTTGTSDGVAHFAHLGGMVFGIILILIWRNHKFDHYRIDN
ncbi:MAG: rhomboid family intramembrane serine protease [Bacteroidales bacterium]|nr:rhomboid family intramembrane serine protease [Bacteroidales bacterium]